MGQAQQPESINTSPNPELGLGVSHSNLVREPVSLSSAHSPAVGPLSLVIGPFPSSATPAWCSCDTAAMPLPFPRGPGAAPRPRPLEPPTGQRAPPPGRVDVPHCLHRWSAPWRSRLYLLGFGDAVSNAPLLLPEAQAPFLQLTLPPRCCLVPAPSWPGGRHPTPSGRSAPAGS
jgi:hypothetical protein